ncbi:Major facilitator superfamily [Paramyrothecium foliicola]|nr:Major facilitator superfamily [Paramyrothecium foliicola]
MKEPWPTNWNGTFDLVHQRMALPGAVRDVVKQVIQNMIALLKPAAVMETDADYAPRLAGWFQQMGLVHVGSKVFDVPLGCRHPKKELQGKSTRLFVLATKGVVDVAKNAKTSLLTVELDNMVPNVEKELYRFSVAAAGSTLVLLCLCTLVSSLDGLIITTGLPSITDSIGGQSQVVWVANSFVFALTVVQPLYAQLFNVFGRRNSMLVSLTLFSIESGVAGGTQNVATMIAGRCIQGLGSAGLFVLSDLNGCDLVPLRERAKCVGVVISS